MRNGRLCGLLLILAGGSVLAWRETLGLQTGLSLAGEEPIFASLALLASGLALVTQNWRPGLSQLAFQGRTALRLVTGRPAGNRPAKRMKIRIRCAR